jgi:hypothetical protein
MFCHAHSASQARGIGSTADTGNVKLVVSLHADMRCFFVFSAHFRGSRLVRRLDRFEVQGWRQTRTTVSDGAVASLQSRDIGSTADVSSMS